MRECSPVDVLGDILMDVPDLVFAYGRDERYLFVNRAAAEFLKADDPFDVIGCHWRELGYPEQIMQPLIDRVAEVARTQQPVSYRFTSSPARGSRTFDMSMTPLYCDDGIPFAVLAIAHDISEFFGSSTG